MRKTILLLMLAYITVGNSIAQNNHPTYIYCKLTDLSGFRSIKKVVDIDFGQESKTFADKRFRDVDGELIEFNSMVDAMNYMGTDGWEFVQAYVVVEDNKNVTHWILKLNTEKLSDEERASIMKRLNTKAPEKKKRSPKKNKK